MSTNSRIGIENIDATVTSIYCHFDGQPKGVGRILQTHYQNRAKVEALIALGDISVLCPELYPIKHKTHTFSRPQANCTIAFHRDRGIELKQQKHSSVAMFLQIPQDSIAIRYAYLFSLTGEWYISHTQDTEHKVFHQTLDSILTHTI
jgi:hypothetical protein